MTDSQTDCRDDTGWISCVFLAAFLVIAASWISLGAEIDGVQVTLQSQRYYAKWDMTRLVYRVKSSSVDEGDYWILAAGECLTADHVDAEASAAFEWVDGAIQGVRFERSKKNQKFYLWLKGTWALGRLDAAVGNLMEAAPSGFGEIEGPSCEGTGLSIEIVHGGAIRFPDLSSDGRHEAEEATRLRVAALSAGWALSYDLEFDLPPGASEETVRSIFEVMVLPYAPGDATSEVDIAYAVDLREGDLQGLPEGEYAITIRYTVSTD